MRRQAARFSNVGAGGARIAGRGRSHRAEVLLFCLALTTVAGSARAESDSPVVEDVAAARAAYREGSRLARQREWVAASEQYRAAYELFPHAATLFNLGYCAEQAGERAEALRAMRGALALSASAPEKALTEEQRAQAELAVGRLEERAAPAPVTAGPRESVQQSEASVPPVAEGLPLKPSPPRSDSGTTFGIATLAVGGGLVVAGLGVGAVAIASRAHLDDSCTPDGGCPPSAQARSERARAATTVATISVLSGVALAGVGGVVLLVRPSKQSQLSLRVHSAARIELSGEF